MFLLRVINASVGEQKGHCHNRRQSVDISHNDECDYHRSHDDHRINWNFVWSPLKRTEKSQFRFKDNIDG